MKGTWALIVALGLGAGSSALAQGFTGYGIIGVRIAVKDTQKSEAFYTKLGMQVGRLYHSVQQEMTWPNPSQGPKVFLVHDESGQSKLLPGTASLMVQVPDVAAFAKDLKASGYPDVGEPKSTDQFVVLMIKDPDGNQIEVLGPVPKK
jgi:predicted lactoylglutathione lyase